MARTVSQFLIISNLEDAAAMDLARQRSVSTLVHHPVNPRVNNARNEGAELIELFNIPA